jgi:hypothetical protein
MGALAAAIGVLARRRSAGRAAVLAAGLSLTAPAAAQSMAEDDNPWWKADVTPARANFEIRYGVIDLDQQGLNDVYSENAHNLLMMELGPQIFRIGEVDLGFGFFQELAYTVTPGDLVQSADRTMLTWFPLYVDFTLRAHLLDEQPAVPFFRYGWDYVIWSERADDGFGGKDVLQGGKFGTHTAIGVNLLLDLVQPGRASFLEARTGINDTWLTMEYRIQAVDSRSAPWSGKDNGTGFDFSGNAFQVGLKLDW